MTARAPDTLVVIPCLDEREALPRVLGDLPVAAEGLRVVVVDNGSTDGSADVARACGAEVVHEPRRGYGSACLAGLAALAGERYVAFLDADYSDHPEEVAALLAPLREDRADLVVGSRMREPEARAALLPQARFGNRLASVLLRLLFGLRASDLGPFRAIRREALDRLGMRDTGYGWTVEMQARAARAGLRYAEVPVRYRARIGRSKISGTLRGSVGAGAKILWTLARLRFSRTPARPPRPGPARPG